MLIEFIFMKKYSKFTHNIGSGNFTDIFCQSTNKFQEWGRGVLPPPPPRHTHTPNHLKRPWLQVYEIFYNSKPCDFTGNQCNQVGLNEGILDIFLTTGKSNTEFSLQLTNGLAIELCHFIIILLSKINSHGKYFRICYWKYQTTKIFYLVNLKKIFVKR